MRILYRADTGFRFELGCNSVAACACSAPPQSPPPPLSQHTFNTHKQPATPAEAFFASDKFRVSHFKVQPEPTLCLFFVCGRDAPQRASSPACRACPQRNTHKNAPVSKLYL